MVMVVAMAEVARKQLLLLDKEEIQVTLVILCHRAVSTSSSPHSVS